MPNEKALAIIDKWIDYAHEKNLLNHKLHFWVARDIIGGRLKYPADMTDNAVEFIKSTKPGPDKDLILEVLNEFK